MRLLRFSDLSTRWLPAAAALVLWALAAGSLALWWLHWPRATALPVTVAGTVQTPVPMQGLGAVERALGHTSTAVAAPDVQKRFSLLGVVAAESGDGSALMAVDGQDPQIFVRGHKVADGWRIESVRPNSVRLAPVQAGATLELPLQGNR